MKKMILPFFFGLAGMTAAAQGPGDTASIRRLLEKEAATWRAGDVRGHAACWQLRPYSKILVSMTDGKCFDVPPERIIHPSPETMGKGGSSANSNYLFSIHDNEAWVSHDERSVAKDGLVTYSHEIRLLEKINGDWKLVGQSIHFYIPGK